ncbi:MAG: hypothetical protein IPP37_17235 [Saprospiraceae bacterium]|nr:hypothetical protein [Saprospiraceae bacterium]
MGISYPQKEVLLIPTQEGFEVIRHDEITRIEADRAYCVLHQKMVAA